MAYVTFSEEEKQEHYRQIKQNVRITDYALSLGYTLVRKGRYYSLKEHDSVRIDTEKNCFYRNSGLGTRTAGSVIDFAMAFGNLSLGEAIKELSERMGVAGLGELPKFEKQNPVPVKEKMDGVQLPEPAQNMRRVYAYLIKSRCIDPDIVQHFVDSKMLYQDMRGNCVFVARDKEQKPVFGCLRGTNTEKRFVGDLPGCDYAKGFYIGNHSGQLIVTESVIDAMSVMSVLKAKKEAWKEYDYMILAGVDKEEALMYQVKEHGTRRVLLALDNDEAGLTAVERIESRMMKGIQIERRLPEEKDWNEEIKAHYKKYLGLENVNFPVSRAGIEEVRLGMESKVAYQKFFIEQESAKQCESAIQKVLDREAVFDSGRSQNQEHGMEL